MKILVTVPHYHSYDPKGVYASNGSPERKAKNLSRLIVQLKMLFESPQAYCRYDLQNEDGSRFSDADLQRERRSRAPWRITTRRTRRFMRV